MRGEDRDGKETVTKGEEEGRDGRQEGRKGRRSWMKL